MINKNIVNYEKLKTILEALWNRTKDKFIEDIVYEVDTNELSKTKNGTKEVVIDHVVERWGDLEHTLHPKNKNIFDKDTQVTDNKYYFVGVGFVNDQNWCMAAIPCSGGEQFTIVKMSNHDSKHFAFLDEIGSLIGELSTPIQTTVNGKAVYKITIPSDLTDVAYFTVNMHKQTVTQDQVMVFSGHLEDNEIPNVYYPYLGDLDVEIDGDKVGIRFNNDSTSLTSTTVVGAIKELDGKITNAGTGGAVTSVNGQQGVVNLNGTHISALMGGSTKPVQEHLQKLNSDLTIAFDNINRVRNDLTSTTNNHNGRITALERKVPTVQVGDIIQTFKNSGDSYTVGGVTYLYIGKTRTVQSAAYPELPSALGITGTVSAFQLPVMGDSNVIYDNGRTAVRKNYIAAKIN